MNISITFLAVTYKFMLFKKKKIYYEKFYYGWQMLNNSFISHLPQRNTWYVGMSLQQLCF